MSGPVIYSHKDSIAVIRMDDGKVNALGPPMQQALNEAIDNAERDNVGALVITGNERVFSGGFDLKILTSGEVQPAIDMLRGGFELAYRLLSYPKPVVMACTGHAIAMGAFLLLSGDYRVGAAGPYKITANEVAIGITVPRPAVEICRQRLAPAHFNRAVVNAEVYPPEAAAVAGFLDRVVGEAQLADAARDVAQQLRALDRHAHAATKLRARDKTLAAVRAAIDLDFAAAATA